MPATRVLIVTTFGRPGYLSRALEAGASGFLVKDTPPEEPLPPGPAPASSTETETETEPETTATDRTVTVAPGDTLWEIAARSLGPQASAPAVDAEWRLWYAANREVIGADPHLLLPGTRLEAPATGTGADR